MNLQHLEDLLNIARKTHLTLNLIGSHGVGKTTFVREYAEKNKIGFLSLRLGQVADVADVAGLNYPITTDKETKLLRLLPEFLPKTGSGILFLDEWNRAHPDLIQPIFQLAEGGMNGYTLPEGWIVVLAMNPATEDYSTIDFSDKALLSRMCHIKVQPTQGEFLQYAKNKMNPNLFEFLSGCRQAIESDTEDFQITGSPDRRAWLDKFSPVLDCYEEMKIPDENGSFLREVLKGIVGLETSIMFTDWYLSNRNRPVSALEALTDPEKHESKIRSYDSAFLSTLIDACLMEIDKNPKKEYFINFAKFIRMLPIDLAVTIPVKFKSEEFRELKYREMNNWDEYTFTEQNFSGDYRKIYEEF